MILAAVETKPRIEEMLDRMVDMVWDVNHLLGFT